jgi:hypothetical protein
MTEVPAGLETCFEADFEPTSPTLALLLLGTRFTGSIEPNKAIISSSPESMIFDTPALTTHHYSDWLAIPEHTLYLYLWQMTRMRKAANYY